jgi:hypothetical protein
VKLARLSAIALGLLLGADMASAQPASWAARMSTADAASEYWDLSARFESGHALVARFQITNEGPGQHTAVAIGHLLFPDGKRSYFHNGRTRKKWELRDDGFLLDVGSSELGLRGPRRSYDVSKSGDGVEIHLVIQSSGASSLASPAGLGGYELRVVDVAAPIEGSIWIRKREMAEPLLVRGRASLVHTWVEERESAVALRRIDVASLGADGAFVLVDMVTPAGKSMRWLALERGGRIIYETGDLEVELANPAAGPRGGEYPIPGFLHFHNASVDGKVELGRILLSRNPMEDLPQPFRFLLSLRTRPRRAWTESAFQLKLQAGSDRSAWQARGDGIASVTYLNPPES